MAIGLFILVFGIVWLTFSTQDDEPAQIFPATINRDCAPWDGSAFTVSIPIEDKSIMDISIYRSPEIRLPVRFSFPDETMSLGHALYLTPPGLPEQLTGTVFFQRVERGKPVEGRFNFTSERGEQFKGRFIAEWGNEIIYCG